MTRCYHALLLGLLGLFPGVPHTLGAELKLFIWSEYLDPAVIRAFETKHTCKVLIDVYEDAETMLAKLQAGGASLYDVAVPPDYLVPVMARLKLLAPLRHDRLPNLRNLEDRFRNPPYDSSNTFSVPYQWGTLGLYVLETNVVHEPPTWAWLFDPARAKGPYVLMDSMRDLIGAALKFQGHSLNSTNLQELKAARDLLIDAKKRSLGLESTVGGKNKVLARAARAAMVYSGEGARGMAENPHTRYVIPREGSLVWVDNLVILADAPQRELAEAFINYLLEPEPGAAISNFTRFCTPNRAAKNLILPELLNHPHLYPPPEIMEKLEWLRDLGPRTRLYDEVWTRIKSR